MQIKLENILIFLAQSQTIQWKEIWSAVHADRELEVVKIPDPTTAALQSILVQELVVAAMLNNGQNHPNISIDMTESLKINAIRPIVGNSTIFPAHINASMQIIRLVSADLHILSTFIIF